MAQFLLNVTLPSAARPAAKVPTLIADDGTRLTLPWAPNDATVDGQAAAWTPVPRTQRQPLLLSAGGQLKTWSAVIPIGHRDWRKSVQSKLNVLTRLAAAGRVVTFAYGPDANGKWRITGCPITVIQRTPHWDPSFVTVALTLTEVSDMVPHVGPVTGGHGIPASPAGRPYPGAPKHYTIRKGDTLWTIAGALYGKAEAWPIIADANKLREARSDKLPVGKKLTIP